MSLKPVVALGALIALIGCSSQVPLTPGVIREYGLTDQDVKKLQLYISGGLLFEQENTKVDKNVDSSHALKTVTDNYVKQIYFKKKTPCIAVTVRSDKLEVAFEPDDRLTFSLSTTPEKQTAYFFDPDKRLKDPNEIKRLPASGYKEWKAMGHETYKDSTYVVLVNENMPYLLADQKGLKKLVVDKRAVRGMRQGGE